MEEAGLPLVATARPAELDPLGRLFYGELAHARCGYDCFRRDIVKHIDERFQELWTTGADAAAWARALVRDVNAMLREGALVFRGVYD